MKPHSLNKAEETLFEKPQAAPGSGPNRSWSFPSERTRISDHGFTAVLKQDKQAAAGWPLRVVTGSEQKNLGGPG